MPISPLEDKALNYVTAKLQDDAAQRAGKHGPRGLINQGARLATAALATH